MPVPVPLRSDRRSFLRSAGLASSSALLAQILPTPLAAAAVPKGFLTSTDQTEDVLFMSATKLAGLIRAKKISAVEAVSAFYARIDAVNPKINAVVMQCRERAFAEAKAADHSLAAGKLWPAVVVRAGTAAAEGLPIGVQIIAQPWREDIAFAVAAKIEAATGGYRKPVI